MRALLLRSALLAVSAFSALPAGAFQILDVMIAPAERRIIWLDITESFAGLPVRAPIHVVRCAGDGPTLWLFGGVHGDELNGVESVRRIIDGVDPGALNGTLVGAPIVNLPAFRLGSRYLPDRRDLNRHFPGDPSGSSAARIAHVFFEQIVRRCSHLVDYHTGSLRRTNVPQVHGNAGDETVRAMMRGFGLVGIDKRGQRGALRGAAQKIGIPSVLFEAGQPNLLNQSHIESGIGGSLRLMRTLEMVIAAPAGVVNAPLYSETVWVRAESGGTLLHTVGAGALVVKGDLLGTVHDPIDSMRSEILSPVTGQIIGLALDKVVMPGFSIFHIAFNLR